MTANANNRKIGVTSATAIVIASMVGTGVFTSLGFQLVGIKHPLVVLLLWVIGGIAALSGAMVYAELGSTMPRSGGEYHYLSKIYHPAVGFLSGWVSVFVGFPAPTALACMAFGAYFSRVLPIASQQTLAIIALVLLTIVHSFGIRIGTMFQNIFSALNIILILFFVAAGLFFSATHVPVPLTLDVGSVKEIFNPAFAVSLVYVSYAFSGWNASAYIAGEIEDPKRDLPRSLCIGTIIVTILYLLLNYTFLATAAVGELAGQIEVGYISAGNIFGERGKNIVGFIISLLLLSSISSFTFVGPRVAQTIGEDFSLLRYFSYRTKAGVPIVAMYFQSLIGLVLIISASFENVLTYVGFALNLCTFLTVMGIFVHRVRYPDIQRPYKTWGYPLVPIVFLLIMAWNLVYLMIERPLESFTGFLTMACGLVVYFAGQRKRQ